MTKTLVDEIKEHCLSKHAGNYDPGCGICVALRAELYKLKYPEAA